MVMNLLESHHRSVYSVLVMEAIIALWIMDTAPPNFSAFLQHKAHPVAHFHLQELIGKIFACFYTCLLRAMK